MYRKSSLALSERVSWNLIDDIRFTGISGFQGHLEFENESHIEFIIFDEDKISKITWNKSSRSHVQSIFKINSRASNYRISFLITGDCFTINNILCPSFMIYSVSSEIFLGVLIEDSIKFWTISSDAARIESAIVFEEGRLYMNAGERSGFYMVHFIPEFAFLFKCVFIFRLTTKV